MITQNNTEQLIQEVKDRLMDGIELAMRKQAKYLEGVVSVPVEYTPRGRVIRSSMGEYPRMETGQLQNNIAYGVDRSRLEGRVGVKGRNTNEANLHANRDSDWPDNDENIGGLAIVALEQSRGRLGLVASFEESRFAIVQEIVEGATR
jgi:hypothetical protein